MPTTLKSTKKLSFKLHPSILISTIQDQAHGIDKAIAELVMNSVDAGANQVEITYDGTFLQVSDNGKGFNKKQVMDYFRTFGMPHLDDDAHYGKFRIGRGQAMSYFKSTWLSGKYQMDVDIYAPLRDENLNGIFFHLTTLTDVTHQGCCIKGELYEEFRDEFDSEISYVRKSLCDLIKYVPIPIIFNGIKINITDIPEQASYEDEYAYYLPNTKQRDLNIYNKGVEVRNASISNAFMTGDIISKKSLLLNTSRNDILTDRCMVWPHIVRAVTEQHDIALIQNNSKLSKDDLQVIMTNIFVRQIQYPDEIIQRVLNTKIFRLLGGDLASLNDLRNYRSLCFISEYDDIKTAEKIKAKVPSCLVLYVDYWSNMAYALYTKQKYEDQVEQIDDEGMYQALIRKVVILLDENRNSDDQAIHHLNCLDFEDQKELYRDVKTTIQIDQLTKVQAIILDLLNQYNNRIHTKSGLTTPLRQIHLGHSEEADAWTDGMQNIIFNVSVEKMFMESGFGRLLFLFLHEYCHTEDSGEGHSHEFFETFHDLVLNHEFSSDVLWMESLAKSSDLPIAFKSEQALEAAVSAYWEHDPFFVDHCRQILNGRNVEALNEMECLEIINSAQNTWTLTMLSDATSQAEHTLLEGISKYCLRLSPVQTANLMEKLN